MINYLSAKEKAMKVDKTVDSALEYKDAYVFYNSKRTGNDTEDNEVVILKSNGNRVSMTEYVLDFGGSKPKKIKF